ncbi:speedy protein A [Hippocampus zosterae]|uniref:speedy protein A n=1 Tax=Hippocampus zosterae TaxID=109293 RepID=UPI00223C984A|nr:speedy protein A [Hippocampus zosterae]XP_051941809.1 speedy protein A [Hippocampus zosterae]
MMKRRAEWCRITTSCGITSRETPLRAQNNHEEQCPPKKSNCRSGMYRLGRSPLPTIVVQQEEMTSYLNLFDDDLIHDFLLMDCCCKMSDKYLLAMVFVYFKRSSLTIAEYTKKNFFIALYLANTMEEEDEEHKYEIFPWALGKTWRKKFKHFLKQRDKLWVRTKFRAAVSKRCCEEVMAIVPSHFVWQRERSEQHSGTRRDDDLTVWFPRGPTASPVPCTLCNRKSTFNQRLRHTLQSPGTLATQLNLENTPPRSITTCRESIETRDKIQHSLGFPEEPGNSSSNSSTDWINE